MPVCAVMGADMREGDFLKKRRARYLAEYINIKEAQLDLIVARLDRGEISIQDCYGVRDYLLECIDMAKEEKNILAAGGVYVN